MKVLMYKDVSTSDYSLVVNELTRTEFITGSTSGYTSSTHVEYVAADNMEPVVLWELFKDAPNICFVDRYESMYKLFKFQKELAVHNANNLESLAKDIKSKHKGLVLVYQITEVDNMFSDIGLLRAYVYAAEDIIADKHYLRSLQREMKIDALLNKKSPR